MSSTTSSPLRPTSTSSTRTPIPDPLTTTTATTTRHEKKSPTRSTMAATVKPSIHALIPLTPSPAEKQDVQPATVSLIDLLPPDASPPLVETMEESKSDKIARLLQECVDRAERILCMLRSSRKGQQMEEEMLPKVEVEEGHSNTEHLQSTRISSSGHPTDSAAQVKDQGFNELLADIQGGLILWDGRADENERR